MPKVIFEFDSKADRDKWLAAYYNSGEQEIDEYWHMDNLDPPEINIREED